MLRHRVIPVLLVKDHGLVKTKGFDKSTYIGDPTNAIRIFNDKEVDELALIDIGATASGRGPNFELVEQVASECFMPLSYGGGIRTLDQAKRLFSLGVEKVMLQSAALDDLSIVRDIANYSGRQSVAVAIDVRTGRFGKERLFRACDGSDEGKDWLGFAKAAQDMGAGEVLLTSVNREGSMEGLDLGLIQRAAACLHVPLVAHGGVGSLADIKAGVEAGADAVAVGSFFVFHGPRRGVLITYPRYDVLTDLLGDHHV